MIISGDFNVNYTEDYEMIDNFAKNLFLNFELNKSKDALVEANKADDLDKIKGCIL